MSEATDWNSRRAAAGFVKGLVVGDKMDKTVVVEWKTTSNTPCTAGLCAAPHG